MELLPSRFGHSATELSQSLCIVKHCKMFEKFYVNKNKCAHHLDQSVSFHLISNMSHFGKNLAMNWGKMEDRVSVIALHKCGHSPNTIFKLLQKLGITLRFVYRTIKRWTNTQSVVDLQKSGRPRTVRTPAVIKAVRARFRRNPVRRQKIMALQMKIKPS